MGNNLFIVTRCEEHADYIEKLFADKQKAEEYCSKFEGGDYYPRHVEGYVFEEYRRVSNALAAYEDKTPITEEFLTRRFVDTRAGWRQNFDDTKILIQRSADAYHVLIFKRECEENKAYIKTVGQLRMLLAICGFEKFANELK